MQVVKYNNAVTLNNINNNAVTLNNINNNAVTLNNIKFLNVK